MKSLDPCPKCPSGRMQTYRSRRLKGDRLALRYLKCDVCGHHGQELLPAPRQRRRTKQGNVSANSGQMEAEQGRFTLREVQSKSHTEEMTIQPPSAAGDSIMLVSIDQFADRSTIDPSTTLSWIEQGLMPAPSIIGDFARWPEHTLQSWCAGGCAKGKAPTFCQFERIRLAYMEDAMLQAAKRIDESSQRIPEHRLDEIFTQVLFETTE